MRIIKTTMLIALGILMGVTAKSWGGDRITDSMQLNSRGFVYAVSGATDPDGNIAPIKVNREGRVLADCSVK